MEELELSSRGREIPPIGEPAGADIPDSVLEALQGTVAGQSADSDSDGTPDGSPAETATLNALAEAAGGSDKLYKMTVSLPDEQGTATIEELKNQATKFRKGEAQQQAFTEEQTGFANEKLRYMQDLQVVVASIPKEHVSEELTKQAAEFVQRQQIAEDRILLSVIPGWADEAVKSRDTDGIKAFLAREYGAPTEAFDQPAPAWARKLVYDHWQLKQRIAALGKKQKGAKPVKPGKTPDTAVVDRNKSAVASAKRGGNKIDAIAALLQE